MCMILRELPWAGMGCPFGAQACRQLPLPERRHVSCGHLPAALPRGGHVRWPCDVELEQVVPRRRPFERTRTVLLGCDEREV